MKLSVPLRSNLIPLRPAGIIDNSNSCNFISVAPQKRYPPFTRGVSFFSDITLSYPIRLCWFVVQVEISARRLEAHAGSFRPFLLYLSVFGSILSLFFPLGKFTVNGRDRFRCRRIRNPWRYAESSKRESILPLNFITQF